MSWIVAAHGSMSENTHDDRDERVLRRSVQGAPSGRWHMHHYLALYVQALHLMRRLGYVQIGAEVLSGLAEFMRRLQLASC